VSLRPPRRSLVDFPRIQSSRFAKMRPRVQSTRAPRLEMLEERSLLTAAPLGNEYQLNTVVTNDQSAVAIGSNPNSTQIVMAWVSASQDGSGDGVYAQRYDLYGNKVGSAFRANVTTSGNQNAPAVGMDSLGNFVIVWQSAGQDGSGDGIYGRRFAFDGTPLTFGSTAATSDARVNSTTSGNQQAPSIAMDDAGEFAVAFQSSGRDASGNAVVARAFKATGSAVANDFQVNQLYTAGNQQAPSIAMDAAGNFTIAWQSVFQAPNPSTDGDFVVAKRYTKTGTVLNSEFVVNQTVAGNQNAPSVAVNADGSFIVAWQSALQDGNSDAIVARRYSSAAAALGNEFLVNQFPTGSQAAPSVTTGGSSGFVIAWQSAAQDLNGDAVVVRQYDASGAAQGDESVANIFTTGAQNNASVAMQLDGDFIVAWQSPGQETGGGTSLGVFARRYNVTNDAPVMRQVSNLIADVGGTLAFTARADDQDLPGDTLTYTLAPGAPAGATLNPTTGEFSWNTTGVTPGRYFVTVLATDQAGLVDEKKVAMTVFAPGERTALDDYVNTLDGNYAWDIRDRVVGDGFTKYDIRLTSGMWRTTADVNLPLWQHWLTLYVPTTITQSKALLFIDGGSNSSTPTASADLDTYAGPLAASSGAVIVDLQNVPNEPLQFTGESFSRSEDSIIAHSWNRYLATGDPTWIVNLPMTRAAMRAMDAISDFISKPVGGNFDIASFVVTGGSKRGWTTWLTSATDPRVSEEAPIVSDLLNMQTSFVHHYAYYNGTFSAAVQDYVNEGILNVNNFGTDGLDSLLSIVDPYSYLTRLTLPKYLINVSGDEFFVPDSSQFYYDQLLGPKAMRYLPNSSHGVSDPNYILESFTAMFDMLQGEPLPQYSFHQLPDGTIELSTGETVTDAKLWQATNPNARDFRWPVVGAAYTSTQLTDQGGGVYRANVAQPTKGYTAYYIEITIQNSLGDSIKVSSGIYLKGQPPTNIQPSMQSLGDVTISEGSPLTVPIIASDPDAGQTLTFSLAAGTPAQLSINPTTGVITGNWNDQVASSISVVATVYDNGTPALPNRDTFLVRVVNAPPSATLNGPATGLPGQSIPFTLLATDPSSVDQAAGFTFKIDWDGDGTVDQTVVGPSGTVVNHVFAPSSGNTIHLTATDKDGGVSADSTLAITLNRPPVDPLDQQPMTLAEGDSLVLQALGWTDPDNNPLTYTWDVDGDGQFDDATGAPATVAWSVLSALGLDHAGATSQVRVRVDDGFGGVTISAPVLLTITNTPPTANAQGPYAIAEGDSLSLSGIGTDPAGPGYPLSYTWDVNGDGVFGDALGASPTLSWSQLVALGINDGPSSFNVQLRVSDGLGGVTDSAPVALTVNNAGPQVNVTGPAVALRGANQTFTLVATDPSAADQALDFTFTINWGDGSPLQTVTGLSTTQVTHAFNPTGVLNISVTAADAGGDSGPAAAHAIQIDAVQLRANAQNGLLTDLVWGGTTLNDQMQVEQVDATTIRIRETLLGGAAVNNVQVFSGITGRAIAYGNAGDDLLRASALSSTHATLDGGAGNNTLYGGAAGDLLIGGSNGGEGKQGNNVIIAGNGDNTIYGNAVIGAEGSTGGNNLIVGGTGSDTIYGAYGSVQKKDGTPSTGGEGGRSLIVGGGGSDVIYGSQSIDGGEGGNGSIIVSGSTTLGQSALLAVLNEWTSTRTAAERIANIEGVGTGPRNNGNVFLQAGVTISDDDALDDLWSDSYGEANWLLYDFSQDDAHRLKLADVESDNP